MIGMSSVSIQQYADYVSRRSLDSISEKALAEELVQAVLAVAYQLAIANEEARDARRISSEVVR